MRRCEHRGCVTVLSRYNPGPFCYHHGGTRWYEVHSETPLTNADELRGLLPEEGIAEYQRQAREKRRRREMVT